MATHYTNRWTWILTSFCLLSLSLSAQVSAKPNTAYEPFNAELTVTRGGMTLGSSQMSLHQADNGNFVLETQATAEGIVALIRPGTSIEHSEFSIKDGYIQSHQYFEKRRRKKITLRGRKEVTSVLTHAEYNWADNIVTYRNDDKTSELALEPKTVDRQLLSLVVRNEILTNGPPADGNTILVPFADKHSIRHYEFSNQGMETITTTAGRYLCLKLQRDSGRRTTTFWLATELDYFPVRVEKQKLEDPAIRIEMTQYQRAESATVVGGKEAEAAEQQATPSSAAAPQEASAAEEGTTSKNENTEAAITTDSQIDGRIVESAPEPTTTPPPETSDSDEFDTES